MTEREGIAAWLRRIGHGDLADGVERYADRKREPTIPASEWMLTSNLGY